MRSIYHLAIRLLGAGIWLAAAFSPKARAWIRGRSDWAASLGKLSSLSGPRVWFHCASLGEFEQARGLMEWVREQHPGWRIVVSFFSPSGYEIRKNSPLADAVCYLPLDTPARAAQLIDALQPSLVFWVRYDFWLNHLRELERRQLPVVLFSARVFEGRFPLRGPFRPLYQAAFASFRLIFAQDEASARLIRDFSGSARVRTAPDTRFDRVWALRERAEPLPEIEAFVQGRFCIVGGSVWPRETEILHRAFEALSRDAELCMILAPHEIEHPYIAQWIERYPGLALPYSRIGELGPQHRILWIDNIGMLARLYRYAGLAVVGGAWGKGLHNILEPAAWGVPTLFGPRIQKFPEAQALVERGLAFSVNSDAEMLQQMRLLLQDSARRDDICQSLSQWVQQQRGGSAEIGKRCAEAGLFNRM